MKQCDASEVSGFAALVDDTENTCIYDQCEAIPCIDHSPNEAPGTLESGYVVELVGASRGDTSTPTIR